MGYMTGLAKVLAIPLLVENQPRRDTHVWARSDWETGSQDREREREKMLVWDGSSGPEVAFHAFAEGLIGTKSTAVDN